MAGGRLRSEVDEFLRRFTIAAHAEKGYDTSGHQVRDMVEHWRGQLLSDVLRTYRNSEQWRQFEEVLSAVSEHVLQEHTDDVFTKNLSAVPLAPTNDENGRGELFSRVPSDKIQYR
jgi:hypothetical protein